jgi:hypothetical protein
MRWFPISAIAARLVLILIATPAFAQRDATAPGHIAVGARVRVTAIPFSTRGLGTTSRDPVVGILIQASGDSLVLRRARDSTRIVVPMSAVQKVEVSEGMRPAKLRGAGYGFVIGVAAGALFGAAIYREPPKRQCTPQEWFCGVQLGPSGAGFAAGAGAVLGGVLGAVTGVVVGAKGVERWAPVDLNSLVRLSVLPSGQGGVLTVGFRF